jgi:hypothetical protein
VGCAGYRKPIAAPLDGGSRADKAIKQATIFFCDMANVADHFAGSQDFIDAVIAHFCSQ